MTTPPPPPPPPPGFQPPGWQSPGGQSGEPASAGTAYPQPGQAPPPGWYAHPGQYAPPSLPVRPPALPAEPAEYHHILRGARRAWWRPLVSFLLVVGGVLVATVGLILVAGIGYVVVSDGDFGAIEDMALDFNNPVTFGAQNLWLAMLIPIAGLATWIAHGVRPGFVSSVVGRFRWGWFGWCLLVIVPLWLLYIGVAVLIDGESFRDTAGRPSSWVALLVLTLLTTPLQAAGEEYLFRGWLMQQIGAWVKSTYVALTLAVVLSSVVFALAHTSLDPWILIDLGSFAAAAVLLTWRTGGLEAAVALHIVNNVIVLVLSILTTGLQDAFITPDTTSDPVTTVISFVALAITSSVIWWLAGRRGVARRSAGART
ncbi:MAG: CPBP family intramembrane metalloprotease [Intrasporangiaceae bacterium]|nr:CPBP family intramembrane metalloprotease [Intrasporangiaceae bacterium]